MLTPQRRAGMDEEQAVASDRTGLSRRGALSGGVMAIASACGLGACASGPPRPLPLQLTDADNDLGRMINAPGGPVVAGGRLNAEALRRFYGQRSFTPVWSGRGAQAEAMVAAVLRAGDHGLDPELFHAPLLERRWQVSPLRRELLLTDAVLSYADALAHGAVPVERRKDFEALAPDRIDVSAAVDAAIGRWDPVSAIEALAPATTTYRALREELRAPREEPRARRAGLSRRAAAAAARAAAERHRSIVVGLERERWLPRTLPSERVWVNVPEQQLVMYHGAYPAFTTRVVVGDNSERNQSPEFDALIEASFFNPPWIVPRDVVALEILPRLERDPDYLARNRMRLLPNGEVEQSAGPDAGLGFLLFEMPNRFDVYLHDTPSRYLFSRSNRRMSRGCIRVENPRELAARLLREPIEAVERRIEEGRTTRTALPRPMPVFVTYQTAVADPDGVVKVHDDFYGRDEELWRRLQKQPVA
ncbi:L,D-transpeptidase family protein [Roseomonas sp. HF4]|uniref:L,D-transpeptidase family protein n=1 Tax=Roseomonas sp. HF4 TaxID=2562313 RepID=UPI0014857390|nr:L,D-transpeptidase family protein [Roseomonas sp. HF4]